MSTIIPLLTSLFLLFVFLVDMLKVAWTTVLPAGPGKNNHEKPQEEEDRGEDKPSDDVPKIGLDRFSSGWFSLFLLIQASTQWVIEATLVYLLARL